MSPKKVEIKNTSEFDPAVHLATCEKCGPISTVEVEGEGIEHEYSIGDNLRFHVSKLPTGLLDVTYVECDGDYTRWLNTDVVFDAVREYVTGEDCEYVRCVQCEEEIYVGEGEEDE